MMTMSDETGTGTNVAPTALPEHDHLGGAIALAGLLRRIEGISDAPLLRINTARVDLDPRIDVTAARDLTPRSRVIVPAHRDMIEMTNGEAGITLNVRHHQTERHRQATSWMTIERPAWLPCSRMPTSWTVCARGDLLLQMFVKKLRGNRMRPPGLRPASTEAEGHSFLVSTAVQVSLIWERDSAVDGGMSRRNKRRIEDFYMEYGMLSLVTIMAPGYIELR
jgi:hypothetical protein